MKTAVTAAAVTAGALVLGGLAGGLGYALSSGSGTTTVTVMPAGHTAAPSARAPAPSPSVSIKVVPSPVVVPRYVPVPDPAPAGTSCGSGLYAGADTSCPFAANVESAYWAAGGGSGITVTAYSPVTGLTYAMYCTEADGTVTCTGGNNALVQFAG